MRLRGQHELGSSFRKADGYAMAALLVSLSVMAVLMTAVMPVWKQTAQREKEAELVFRGQQYVHAVQLFQRRSGPGTYPPSFDFLVEQKFLRKKYKDPITNSDFLPVPGAVVGTGATTPGSTQTGAAPTSGATAAQPVAGPGGSVPGGLAGVMSKSTDKSIRIYNGQTHYNEWVFRALAPAPAAGGPGGPGGRGQRGAGPNTPNQPPVGGGLGGGPPRGGGPPGRGRFGADFPNAPPGAGQPRGGPGPGPGGQRGRG